MTVATGLAGRAAEIAELSAVWQDALNGHASSIVLTGPPGCGKSALLGSLRTLATADTVLLEASGHPAEAELPYAGLHQLLRPLRAELDPILRSAASLGPGTAADRMGVAAALLETLASLSAAGPVMIAIDDLHWLDQSTRQALVFAARRLDAERLLLVATAPTGETLPARELAVRPLSDDAARQLLQARHPDLHPVVVGQVVANAGGLPLVLNEISDGLRPDQQAGHAPLPPVLSAGPLLTALYRDKLDQLEQRARDALLLVALAGFDTATATRALADAGLSLRDLNHPEGLGLISMRSGGAAFAHPAVRMAVHAGAEPARIRHFHGLLAEVAADPVARGWHVHHAEGATDLDPYNALRQAAEHAATLGALVESAYCWQSAAEHAPDDATTYTALSESAAAMLAAGMITAAEPLVRRLTESAPTSLQRASWATQRLSLAMWRSSDECLGDDVLLDLGAMLLDTSDDSAAAGTGLGLLRVMLMAHVIWGVDPPVRLIELVRQHSPELTGTASTSCLLVDALNGSSSALDALVDACVAEARSPRSLGEAMEVTSAAYGLLWLDRVDACEQLVARWEELDLPPLSELRAVGRMLDGLCAARRGDWARARLELRSGERIAVDGDLPVARLMIRRHHAVLAAYTGDDTGLTCSMTRSRPIRPLPTSGCRGYDIWTTARAGSATTYAANWTRRPSSSIGRKRSNASTR